MIEEELFRLEREAEERVRKAGEREIDRGGPGSARRASEAMDAPMLEVAAIRRTRQRFGDLRMEMEHHKGVLRRTKRNPDLPPDVKRNRFDQAETKLAKLEADHRVLEVEAEQRFFPATNSGSPGTARRAAEGVSGLSLGTGRSSNELALKPLGLRPSLTPGESEPKRRISSGREEPSVSSLPQYSSKVAHEEEEGAKDGFKSGIPQPDIYLGSLVPKPNSSIDKHRGTPGPDEEDGGIGTIFDAVISAVPELFEGPYGFSREDLGPLVNRTPQEARTPVFGLIRTFNEILIRGGSQGVDLALRTLTAPVVAGVVAVGETAVELGMSRGEAGRLMRDLFMGAEVAALELGANRTAALRPRTPRPPVQRRSKGVGVSRPGSLIDQAEQSGILDEVLKRLSPDQRYAALAEFRRSYDEGVRIGQAELRRRGLAAPAKPLPNLPAQIGTFVDRSLKVKDRTEILEIGRVSDAEAIRLKLDTGLDLQGYRHVIDGSGVRHTVRQHGNAQTEALRGQIAVKADDFALIPKIISAPDKVSNGGKNKIGRDLIVYEKRFNGVTYYVEEVRTGRKVAALQSMWKRPSK